MAVPIIALYGQWPLGEGEDIRNTFGPRWFIVGWTKQTEDQIEVAFTNINDSFSIHDRLRNNCRRFLQSGAMCILESKSIWDEDLLRVEAGIDLSRQYGDPFRGTSTAGTGM
jgi:hypothetical protein